MPTNCQNVSSNGDKKTAKIYEVLAKFEKTIETNKEHEKRIGTSNCGAVPKKWQVGRPCHVGIPVNIEKSRLVSRPCEKEAKWLERTVSNSTATTVPLDEDSIRCPAVHSGVSKFTNKNMPQVAKKSFDDSNSSEHDDDQLAPLFVSVSHMSRRKDDTNSLNSSNASKACEPAHVLQSRRGSIVAIKHVEVSNDDENQDDLSVSSFNQTSTRIRDLPRELEFNDESTSNGDDFDF